MSDAPDYVIKDIGLAAGMIIFDNHLASGNFGAKSLRGSGSHRRTGLTGSNNKKSTRRRFDIVDNVRMGIEIVINGLGRVYGFERVVNNLPGSLARLKRFFHRDYWVKASTAVAAASSAVASPRKTCSTACWIIRPIRS